MPRVSRLGLVLLASVAYVPLLLTQPGWVGADTKHYLYLDPWRLMARAASVWDPSIGLGTVTHQNIGYLWPMGPWYAAFDLAGAPDWVAQRLWLASLFFAAGAGTLVLLRLLGLTGVGAVVAALAYQLSPYVLTYAARISAILLPWAGLPWLLVFTILALRRGGWRWPAAVALLVTTVGSINASSLLYAAVAAALWVPYAVVLLREVTWSAAWRTVGRIASLTVVTQVWWVVALLLSGAYGPPVLRTTETLETVSTSSVTSEVVRSLGNWFFYGRDAVGPWVRAAVDYQTEGWLIAVTFAVPVLALLGAALTRWAHRTYFLSLVVVGGVVAVAAHPWHDPSPLGALTKLVADSSSFALALRNAQRATPLIALGFAAVLGAGVHALGRRIDRGDVLAAIAAASLVAVSLPSLWTGGLVDPNLRRPERIPRWNVEAAELLDARDDGTRVLELPGSDFAAHRWGNTIDPLLPGLMDRPWVSRESAPQGTRGTISLLTALDRRLQEGVLEPQAIAVMARLLGAGDVVVRGDLQTERYRTPRPRVLADLVTPTPQGLAQPIAFGPVGANVPPESLPLVDEVTLGLPATTPDLAALTVFPVEEPRPIVRVKQDRDLVLVDGDGEGLVELAEAGLLDGDDLIVNGPNLSHLADVGESVPVFVTDTNRRRAQRFSQLRDNYGYTETASETHTRADPSDARIDLFPEAGDEARSVAVLTGGLRSVQATGYGNAVTYIPEERPFAAVDGDPATAWRVGAFAPTTGHRLRVEFDGPRELDHLQLTQPLTADRNRWITRVEVTVDGASAGVHTLDERSRRQGGQRIDFAPRRGTVVELVVVEDSAGRRPDYLGLSAVGFAEVGIDGIAAEEWIRPPTTLLDGLEGRLAPRPLTYVFARQRVNPREPVRSDPERHLARILTLPDGEDRTFDLTGTARISALVDDAAVDRMLGHRDASQGGLTAISSTRLPGSLASRASSALDGDPATAWTPAFNAVGHQWLEVTLPRAATFDRLDLEVLTDGRHSVPAVLLVETASGARTVALPPYPDSSATGRTHVPVTFEPLRGERVRVTVLEVRHRTTVDYFTRAPIALPFAIAELGLAGARRAPAPPAIDSGCRDDLLAVDGTPVPVRIRGTTESAAKGDALQVAACASLPLAAGEHRVRAAPGSVTGWDLDRLVVASPGAAPAAHAPAPRDAPPAVAWTSPSRSTRRVEIDKVQAPGWLVLGESWSEGWAASIDGRDLGTPLLVDGFANGWRLDPRELGPGPLVIELAWAPQRAVDVALVVSAAGAVAAIVLVVAGGRSERRREVAPAGAQAAALTARGRLVATLSLAAFGALVASPALGVATGALAAAALWTGRWLTMAVATSAAAACGAATLLLQMRHGYPPGFSWASNFDRLHPIGWFVLLAIAVEVVRTVLQERDEHREAGTRRAEVH